MGLSKENTTPFKQVLFGVARRLGLDPKINLQQNVADALAGYIAEHVRRAWTLYQWPELCPTERRVYRPEWDADTVYAEGQEVWDCGQRAYYRSLSDGNRGNPVTGIAEEPSGLFVEIDVQEAPEADASADWVRVTDLVKLIVWDQPGKTRIGDVLEIWRDDPERAKRPRTVPFLVTTAGIQLASDAPDMVWINFRLRPPEFKATPWKAARTYTSGEMVYFSDGECYRAAAATAAGESPATAAAKWEWQPVPRVLANYATIAAYAEALEEDGESDKASANFNKADSRLADEMDRYNVQQRQSAQFSVRGR